MPIGTMRSGCGEYHSSKNQSFHACVTARPRSRSAQRENTEPQKPVICDGKFTRRPHAVDVHVADARVDLVTPGPHLVEARRLDLPVFGLAADDRVEADLEEHLAVELPDLVALFGLDDLRRLRPAACAGSRPSNMCGGSTRWSSVEKSVWRIGARLGIGQQPVRLALAPAQPDGLGHAGRLHATTAPVPRYRDTQRGRRGLLLESVTARGRYFWRMVSASMLSLILSPTTTPPASSAMFQLRPQSLRLISVLALKPARVSPNGRVDGAEVLEVERHRPGRRP